MPDRERASSEHVWYVAYGSNLHGPRLQRYLDRAPDARPPVDRRATALPHRLFFAERSTVWGGGRAYVDAAHDAEAGTLATAWLLTRVQFASVLAQENGWDPDDGHDTEHHAAHGLAMLRPGQRTVVRPGRYASVLGCRSPDHRPAFTFTTAASPLPAPTRPSGRYVEVIVAGLVDGHDLAEEEARRYVAARIV